MPETAIVAISLRGAALARKLAASLQGENVLYLERRLSSPSPPAPLPPVGEGWPKAGVMAEIPFDLPLRPVLQRLFGEYRSLVLFMPIGAAVRLLAPCIKDKHDDPAVVCVDDAGRFAVSLLSGHVGGADSLTDEVARVLGATPVITSASHVTGTLAVDLMGREFGWRLEADNATVTRASAAVVNSEAVGVLQDAGEPNWWPYDGPLPDNIRIYPSLETLAVAPCAVAMVITDRLLDYHEALRDKLVVVYRPRSLAVGMGCRRGVPAEELEQLLKDAFRSHGLALESIYCITTAELKRDEPGINQLAEKLGVPVYCYGADELNSQFQKGNKSLTPSSQAHRLLGLWGVSEPAALLASGGNELLVTRMKTSRATIAVARKEFTYPSPSSPALLPLGEG